MTAEPTRHRYKWEDVKTDEYGNLLCMQNDKLFIMLDKDLHCLSEGIEIERPAAFCYHPERKSVLFIERDFPQGVYEIKVPTPHPIPVNKSE